jgi:hypothetical protein
MCGRYRRTTQEEELARLYHIPIPSQTDLRISEIPSREGCKAVFQPHPPGMRLRLRNS